MMKFLRLKLIFLVCMLGSTLAMRSDQSYKLYLIYTPSHEYMYKTYFLPSIKDDFQLCPHCFEQDCPQGVLNASGFLKTAMHKLETLEKAVLENIDQVVFFSDVDIIFLKPVIPTVLHYLEEHDLVAQQGWPSEALCSGFIAMRANHTTLKMIQDAMDILVEYGGDGDQSAIRESLKINTQLKWCLLPPTHFPNGARVMKSMRNDSGKIDRFEPGTEIELDEQVLLFHANWCLNIEYKYDFLEAVQSYFNAMQERCEE